MSLSPDIFPNELTRTLYGLTGASKRKKNFTTIVSLSSVKPDMPFIPQAVVAKRIKKRQKSRENKVKQKQYLCHICENVILTQENFKKHYNEIHQIHPPIPKYSLEDEISTNCTIL